MRYQTYRRIIVQFTFIHFIFVLFLSAHFNARGGVYTEDGLSIPSIVEQQMQFVKEGLDQRIDNPNVYDNQERVLSTASFAGSVVRINNLLTAAILLTGLYALFFFVFFYYKTIQVSFSAQATPVQLSIRLDN